MTLQQREELDAQLRQPQPAAPTDLAGLRAWFAEIMAAMPRPDGLRTTQTEIGGRPALAIEPAAGATRPGTLLYLHGGAWVAGSPQTAIGLTGFLVERVGVRAVSLDYRLAPEDPFPAAVDDVVAAYRELLERGHDPASIAFAGDSAGGGLAVTGALAARDRGLPLPAAIACFSPGFDHTRSGASMTTKADRDPILSRELLLETGAQYVGGQDPAQPLLSPAISADLRGFPPLLLQVGTNEILLDDSVRLADRAREHEVDVILDVVAGVPHVFQNRATLLTEADEALDRAALFLRQRLVG
jgi:acetyl esterase/lipase